jgi:glycosyltransferase involved in cell wall biosynthesis
MENCPKITIVTVCFNAEETIENTILSVINQTYMNIEYIIIDGNSTDGTLNIIKKYSSRIAYWISEPDKGVYDAMNKALKVASGDYLIFMGADDVLYTNSTLANMVMHFSNEEVVYYGNVRFKGTNKIHYGKFNKLKWAISNISHQALFYPRKIYSTHIYNTKYRVYADYAYNLNLLVERNRFEYINNIITLYNLTGLSATAKDKEFEKDYPDMVKHAVGSFYYYLGCYIRNTYYLKESLLRKIVYYAKNIKENS